MPADVAVLLRAHGLDPADPALARCVVTALGVTKTEVDFFSLIQGHVCLTKYRQTNRDPCSLIHTAPSVSLNEHHSTRRVLRQDLLYVREHDLEGRGLTPVQRGRLAAALQVYIVHCCQCMVSFLSPPPLSPSVSLSISHSLILRHTLTLSRSLSPSIHPSLPALLHHLLSRVSQCTQAPSHLDTPTTDCLLWRMSAHNHDAIFASESQAHCKMVCTRWAATRPSCNRIRMPLNSKRRFPAQEKKFQRHT